MNGVSWNALILLSDTLNEQALDLTDRLVDGVQGNELDFGGSGTPPLKHIAYYSIFCFGYIPFRLLKCYYINSLNFSRFSYL